MFKAIQVCIDNVEEFYSTLVVTVIGWLLKFVIVSLLGPLAIFTFAWLLSKLSLVQAGGNELQDNGVPALVWLMLVSIPVVWGWWAAHAYQSRLDFPRLHYTRAFVAIIATILFGWIRLFKKRKEPDHRF